MANPMGVPAAEFALIPVAISVVWTEPPSYQLPVFLRLSYGVAHLSLYHLFLWLCYVVVSVSELPDIRMAIPIGVQLQSYQLFLWLFPRVYPASQLSPFSMAISRDLHEYNRP